MDKWEDLRNFFSKFFNFNHSLFFIRLYFNKKKYKKYFDNIESQPLTNLQRNSILLDEKRNLVVAGAGTGKTSTIIGKIGYLVKSNKASPKEILTLAYNRSAAKELKDRIKNRIGIEVQAETFHSIGNQIIRNSSNKNLKISNFVDQEFKLNSFIKKIIKKASNDKEVKSDLAHFFSKLMVPYKDEHADFDSIRDYVSWVRSIGLKTLAGEKVKSYGELQIANYLFINGIKYSYEAYYQPKKSTKKKFYYKPDFYIHKYDTYIEYFGIDERGRTAPYINSVDYNNEIKWKRNIHEEGKTNLIEIHYSDFKDNTWESLLSNELNKFQIKSYPLTDDQIIKTCEEEEKNTPFIKLIIQFLEHFKSNIYNRSLDRIRKENSNDYRSKVFLDIFEAIFNEYQEFLKSNDEIDFNDMINYASDLVRKKQFKSPWKYILVDEYQDISQSRYQLIRSLANQNDETKIYCVGDDWQSIYRFAGSDFSLMKNFRNYFGKSSIVKLDTTFRFDNQISKTSEKFILKNPNQLIKNLDTLRKNDSPSVYLKWTNELPWNASLDLVEDLAKNKNINGQSLQILARYNHNLPNSKEMKFIRTKWRGEVYEPKSIHALKGLEADIVIVSDLVSNELGFPSLKEDDPILEIVLSNKENFPHAEERRLLYVAMTRAKNKCYLISDPNIPSEFSLELKENKYNVEEIDNDDDPNKKCPKCNEGQIYLKSYKNSKGEKAEFYSCNNYPVCNYAGAQCEKCGTLIAKNSLYRFGYKCQSETCNTSYSGCPKCNGGILTIWEGRFGKFEACHLYLKTGCEGKGKKKIFN